MSNVESVEATGRVSRETLASWVARGLISEEQALAIEAAEAAEGERPRAPRAFPRLSEALSYVGTIVTLMGASAAASAGWDDLGSPARLSVVGLATLVAWLGGRAVGPSPRSDRVVSVASRRLGSLLWFLSTAGVAGTSFIAIHDVAEVGDKATALLVGMLTTGFAGALWWRRRSGLQQLAFFLGLVATVIALLSLPERPPGPTWFGLSLWALGVVWGWLGWKGKMLPQRMALAIGAVTPLIGAEVMSVSTGGLIFGLATAAALVAAGVWARRVLLVAAGTVGVLIFLSRVVEVWLEGSVGAALALMLAGLVVLAIGVLAARMQVET